MKASEPVISKSLSGRETQILGLAASGLLNKEIAAELDISLNTLSTYWKRIRAKQGDATRAALVASFVRDDIYHIEAEPKDDKAGMHKAYYYASALARCRESERRASRALKVLSGLNRAILSIQDDQELMYETCRILVDTGGYIMTWIGIPVNDEEKSVRPFVHYGDKTSYLHSVRISWGENQYGMGPSGRSIRTGKTQVNRDFQVDSKMTPWRDWAIKAGFQSSISIPMLNGKQVEYVIVAYAPEPDGFDGQEICLLEEVASILSLRIHSLRHIKASTL